MHTSCGHLESSDLAGRLKARFCSAFQRKLRDALSRDGSAAENFGIVWQETLERVPLEEPDQAEVYWKLIEWAKSESYSQFTSHSWS